ncbi:hypothetical protein [Microlunatus parietis]|uniref:N-acetyltransferase domain-containing protein n=1 Tax=Microlunatus parietis TaxID=682979 RepID=A0A7Y9I4D6_9ACTN|nr:hypothetical protein [Microlunatus parietis]NYE69957.1 hypothetical protein [Microlunatus parietis]
MTLDPRRVAAIEASRAWYELTYGLHGIRHGVEDGLWIALDPPPPWHSGALTLRPGLSAAWVAEQLGPDFALSVADAYADLDLSRYGFEVLFDATWIHAPAPTAGPVPDGWSVIDSAPALAEWSELHDYRGVLTEPSLRLPDLRVLARRRGTMITAGAVLHRTGPVVAVSNVWSAEPPSGWAEIMIMAGRLFPGRPMVGYESGRDLADARAAGFVAVGPHRVWRPCRDFS